MRLSPVSSRSSAAAPHRRDQVLVGVEEAPGIAVGIADQALARRVGERRRVEQRLRAIEQRLEVVVVERLQHVHRRARQQRRDDLERRVLGGRADEGEEARLDVRQEGVLLALVEAMDLVDEDDGRPARGARRLRPLDRLADVLDAAEHRRHGDELGVERVGHQARQRRLADPRRTPQDHRVQSPGFERHAQRLAGAEQVALADDLVERLRAQPFGERSGGGVGEAEFERGLGHGPIRWRGRSDSAASPTRPRGGT